MLLGWDPPMKMIYFPMKHESKRVPYVIYVKQLVTEAMNEQGEYLGSSDAEELAEGRFGWYRSTRCRPFSDELMQACMDLEARRVQVEKDYETLMKRGRLK